MPDPDSPLSPDPVVIAGSPGSGTRVLASIAQGLGIYIGEELNHALDNYWWTPLFKRSEWFLSLSGPSDPRFMRYLEIFLSAMAGRLTPTPWNLFRVVRAGLQSHVPLRHPLSAFRSRGYDPSTAVAWGWKEPWTHIMLAHFHRRLPDMRYIHILRHGLDMAYTERPQLYLEWQDRFEFETRLDELPEPAGRLKFWIRANRWVLEFLQKELPNNHLILRFEELVTDPPREIERVIDFLDVDPDTVDVDQLADPIKVPESVGRYRDGDPDIFDDADFRAVEEMGYDIDWD